jgi:peptidoglycan hydrolase-like protein with peptidoglycan-binding domain
VKALQCLLTEQKAYDGRVNGVYNAKTLAAARAWQQSHDLPVRATFNRRSWMSLLSVGPRPVLKTGSTGSDVRRVQRVLNAAAPDTGLAVTGLFDKRTDAALRAWQRAVDRKAEGVVNPSTWTALAAGTRA